MLGHIAFDPVVAVGVDFARSRGWGLRLSAGFFPGFAAAVLAREILAALGVAVAARSPGLGARLLFVASWQPRRTVLGGAALGGRRPPRQVGRFAGNRALDAHFDRSV